MYNQMTNSIGLAGHVKGSPFEGTEVLEEYGNKCSDVFGRLFRCALSQQQ